MAKTLTFEKKLYLLEALIVEALTNIVKSLLDAYIPAHAHVHETWTGTCPMKLNINMKIDTYTDTVCL